MRRRPPAPPAELALRALAEQVAADGDARRDAWRGGFTRRQVLAGGLAGVAALGSQLATARVSFGAAPGQRALVVVFLRGGVDGLSVVVPAGDPHYATSRPKIAVPAGRLLPLARGFGLHPALAPLHELWKRGQFTAVPATSTPDLSRSHFQAQDCLERGGSAKGNPEGWLDRVLDALGPGTTFRSVAAGVVVPRSLAGDQAPLALRDIDQLRLRAPDQVHDRTLSALKALYTGFEHPLVAEAAESLTSLDVAARLNGTAYQPAAAYPEGDFAAGLAQVARLIKSDVGVRVACVDVGGWDMHTFLGTVDDGSMHRQLTMLGQSLGAFAADLGPRLADVTVVAMTEFGRRIDENANGGTDHGHGAAVLLVGGGLAGGTIHGRWPGLVPAARDRGDVAGANDYRDVLAEVVTTRLGVSPAALGTIFPGHPYRPLGVTRG
jgi:uncharacterized protein (DUF1501 family)